MHLEWGTLWNGGIERTSVLMMTRLRDLQIATLQSRRLASGFSPSDPLVCGPAGCPVLVVIWLQPCGVSAPTTSAPHDVFVLPALLFL